MAYTGVLHLLLPKGTYEPFPCVTCGHDMDAHCSTARGSDEACIMTMDTGEWCPCLAYRDASDLTPQELEEAELEAHMRSRKARHGDE